ncbi:DUF1302 domain-containing protein [Azospira sp. I09]|uniref:DUF1302 domain-containing protein n=1 Tax=Azospira sp. I09 TaxID=1765049 RepID=UPI0012607198|nr:DUF1302 domain-containing protein [Azospira sp. I09]BBN89821.1 hypothetical protein AZSP09_28440 [Azospira sp. I09]BBN90896.1 hypothetical protein AZSP09_39190 [Azospira sp. I09]
MICTQLVTLPFRRRPLVGLLAMFGTCLGGLASAAELELGEWKGSINTTVVVGTQTRMQSQDQKLMFKANGASQGMGGNALTGQNDDDSNLNYKKGDQVSTVLKAYSEMRLKREDTEVVLAAKAWYDYGQSHDDRPWGNYPNGYRAGEPLSDNGFDSLAKFSGVALMNAYVGQRFSIGGQALDVRLGNQVLQQWGERSSIGGGLAAISPIDIGAFRRPGALAAESTIPVPQITARWQFVDNQSVEAFYQFMFRHSELPGCGTYFAASDYLAEGCNGVFPGGAQTDGAKLAAGNFVKRTGTVEPDDGGQFGLAYRLRLGPINTNLALYFAQYHNRLPNLDVVKSTRATPYIPGDPGGLNAQYGTEYADNVRVWGLSFDSKVASATVFGELTYRPNQPLGLNGTDLLNAFLSNTAPTPLRQDAINTAAGGTFQAFDRKQMLQLQLGVLQPFKDVLGADTLILAGEAGYRRYPNLPDVNQRRYGRSTVFGLGPVNGVCTAATATCSNDGYVTEDSWGYRLRASARYPGLLAGADLVPTIGFAHDVKGWTHDNTFNQGRKILNVSLRGEYQKRYFADVSYFTVLGKGGDFDNLRDRDYLNLAVGYSF